MRKLIIVVSLVFGCAVAAHADRLHLKDGSVIEADEAWDDPQGVWYRRGGVTYFVDRERVKTIERGQRGGGDGSATTGKRGQTARLVETGDSHHAASGPATESAATDATGVAAAAGVEAVTGRKAVAAGETITLHLVGGASFEVDEATETADGVWYRRGNVSIFVDRARIERIERRRAETEEAAAAQPPARRERRWSTGSGRLDQLIRQNGARHGVDPYLIFLVMEQESHFNSRAVSPAGARGLMQLMPGTAARFGVRNPHDPAQSVSAGTRYLKQLLGKFNNRIDLVLAGYNAGEGNVRRFGYRVPPFRETRNYVRKISSRYGQRAHAPATKPATKPDEKNSDVRGREDERRANPAAAPKF